MNTSVRRLRGAVLMGLAWAVVWGPAAVLIGLMVDPDGSMDEMWVAIGAIPGFLGGVAFSIVLALAAGRRHLEELSTARVAGWGALGGVLVGVLPFVIGDPSPELPLPLLAAVVIGTIALLSAASAAASLALARKPARPDRLGGGVDVLRVSRSAAPARELPGRTPGARRDA
jgi:hypothetical protein